MIIKQNEKKWKFGLKWINGRILTKTDFVDKMEKWNGKKRDATLPNPRK